MATATEASEAEELVVQMRAIRNESEAHVAELHEQAARLTDWREHIRAQPLVAVGLAAFIGFSLTRNISTMGSSRSRKLRQSEVDDEQVTAAATSAGLSSGVMAFLGSLASAAVRQYALQKLRGFSHHE